MMVSFAWPWMALLLPLPFLVRRFFVRARQDKRAAAAPELFFPHLDRLTTIYPPHRRDTANRLFLLLLSLVWLCLVAALMRPQRVDDITQVRSTGYDLMLAVDLSGSMRTLDYVRNDEQVSRLDVVKSVVSDFVAERDGDRIGLILFGSAAYLHVPLTLDSASVRKMLDNAQSGEAGDLTAIGDAIGLAVGNLRHRPEKSRVIILLTDGGDNASTIPPLEAAKLAQQYGIRIYTIGVGSVAPIEAPTDSGQTQMVQSDLDETLLRKIAAATGGAYFRAADTAALRGIYARINSLEKTEAETRNTLIRKPLFRYPLGIALLLLLPLPFFGKARRG